MIRALRSSLCAALLAAATLAAIGVSTETADAAASCTGYAAMPKQVALTSRSVVVRAYLDGSSACTSAPRDYGATATLRNPSGSQSEYQRWTRFGTSQKLQFTVNVDQLGTYTMRGGNVQVYDSGEVRVPSSWRNTTVTVKNGARFTAVQRSGATVRATLSLYTQFGWRASSGTVVALEQRHGSSWRIVARTHAGRNGAVAVHAPAGSSYRLVSATSPVVWGTTTTVR